MASRNSTPLTRVRKLMLVAAAISIAACPALAEESSSGFGNILPQAGYGGGGGVFRARAPFTEALNAGPGNNTPESVFEAPGLQEKQSFSARQPATDRSSEILNNDKPWYKFLEPSLNLTRTLEESERKHLLSIVPMPLNLRGGNRKSEIRTALLRADAGQTYASLKTIYGSLFGRSNSLILIVSGKNVRILNLNGREKDVLFKLPNGQMITIGPGTEMVISKSLEAWELSVHDDIARRSFSKVMKCSELNMAFSQFSFESVMNLPELKFFAHNQNPKYIEALNATIGKINQIRGNSGFHLALTPEERAAGKSKEDSSKTANALVIKKEKELAEKAKEEARQKELVAKAKEEAKQKELAAKAKEEARQKELAAKAKEEARQKELAAKTKEEARQKELAAKAKEEARKQKELAAKAKEEARQKELAAKAKEEARQKELAAKAKEEEEEARQKELAAKAKEEARQKELAAKAKEEARQKELAAKAKEEARQKELAAKAKEEARQKELAAKAKEEARQKELAAKAKEEARQKELAAKAKEEAKQKELAARAKEEKSRQLSLLEKAKQSKEKAVAALKTRPNQNTRDIALSLKQDEEGPTQSKESPSKTSSQPKTSAAADLGKAFAQKLRDKNQKIREMSGKLKENISSKVAEVTAVRPASEPAGKQEPLATSGPPRLLLPRKLPGPDTPPTIARLLLDADKEEKQASSLRKKADNCIAYIEGGFMTCYEQQKKMKAQASDCLKKAQQCEERAQALRRQAEIAENGRSPI